ncbi:MAG: quinone-dependent dihydroorotate dehydrogenase [Geminicoccaceae bacterium]|nr:quinone-dependent dihydroorotate dehydrogenase [Geminicoccaceae bacterium]
MLARLLRVLPAETAHAVALAGLRPGWLRRPAASEPGLETRLFDRVLAHPVGLAAGFDKDAVAVRGLFGLGFSSVEVGTLTPRPQPGNPRPRLFRLTEDHALINRMGFNNRGHEAAARRLAIGRARPGLLGVNLGINKGSADPGADYVAGVRRFAGLADYLVINVSSPNTPGLRDLQAVEALGTIVDRVLAARADLESRIPILLKIAPDMAESDALRIADLTLERGLGGLIVSNTTVARPPDLRSRYRDEMGGLSGPPLFGPSTALLRAIFRRAGPELVLIGVGGVDSGEAAYAKIRAGATAVQLYTAFVYQGPKTIRRVVRGLAQLLRRDRLGTLDEARGLDA